MRQKAERDKVAQARLDAGKRADAVEALARSDAKSLKVIVRYRGLVLKFHPGKAGEPTLRLACIMDLTRAVDFISRHQEDFIGALRAEAKGQRAAAPMTIKDLAARLADDCRRSIKGNLSSIELTDGTGA